MSNGDWGPSGATRTLPPGAGPDDPAIVDGDVTIAPPELVAFYAARGETIVALRLFRLNAAQYEYQALILDPDPVMATGTGDAGIVVEITREYSFAAGMGRFEITSGIFRIKAATDLDVEFGSTMFYDGVSLPQGEQNASYGIVGNLVTCVGPEIAMPSYGVGGRSANFTFESHRLYQIDASFVVSFTAAGGTAFVLRLRKGLNAIAGQELGRYDDDTFVTTAGTGCCRYATFYVKNDTAAAINTSLGFTLARSAGPANINLYGDPGRPLIVRVNDITSRLAPLGGVAASIV